MEPAACWFKRTYAHLCVCDGVSSASSHKSNIDVVNFEPYYTLHPEEETDDDYEPACAAAWSAVANAQVPIPLSRLDKGKAPANPALKRLMWNRLAAGGGASCPNDEKAMGNEGGSGRKITDNNVVITELIDQDKGVVHATPYDVVVRGAPCCTQSAKPEVLTIEDDGLCVVASRVRPRNACEGGEQDGVTVVVESLVARPQ